MTNVFDVADFFINVTVNNNQSDDFITNLKLNKLLYFAQGYSFAMTGKPLFNDKIEAWQYGPVVRSVYDKYRVCGKEPITSIDEDYSESIFSTEELEILLKVMRDYGKYTGSYLIKLTHQDGTPWKKCITKHKIILFQTMKYQIILNHMLIIFLLKIKVFR